MLYMTCISAVRSAERDQPLAAFGLPGDASRTPSEVGLPWTTHTVAPLERPSTSLTDVPGSVGYRFCLRQRIEQQITHALGAQHAALAQRLAGRAPPPRG